jgi:hypothetical protein
MDDKSLKPFAFALVQVLVVGAAQEDARHVGRGEDVRQAVLPLLAQFQKDGKFKPLFDAIRSVLGPDWEPSGAWKDKILEYGAVLLEDDK